jgi:hypothetical protein
MRPGFTLINTCVAWPKRLRVDEAARIGTPQMTRALKAGLLFFFFALCACSLLIAQKFQERIPAPVPRELFAVVNQQLAAFRSADFQSAYRQAATGVQHKFTLGQFETMVRQSYPTMTQAQRVEYGLARTQGGTAVVQVFFFDGDGMVRAFLYSLIKEDDSWRIDGVEELRSYRAGDRLAGTHA